MCSGWSCVCEEGLETKRLLAQRKISKDRQIPPQGNRSVFLFCQLLQVSDCGLHHGRFRMRRKVIKHLPERKDRGGPPLNAVQRPNEPLQQLAAMHRSIFPGKGLQRSAALGQPGIHLRRKVDIPVRTPPPGTVVIRATQESGGIHGGNRLRRREISRVPAVTSVPAKGAQLLQ